MITILVHLLFLLFLFKFKFTIFLNSLLPSVSAYEYFKKTYNRETVLIHNGVERPLKREAEEITKLYGLSKNSYICMISRLTAEKGVHYLIDAYNSIKTDKKLVIAGDTSDTDEYVEMLKEKASGNENIIFTGFISGNVLSEIYSNNLWNFEVIEIDNNTNVSSLENLSLDNKQIYIQSSKAFSLENIVIT